MKTTQHNILTIVLRITMEQDQNKVNASGKFFLKLDFLPFHISGYPWPSDQFQLAAHSE